MREVLPTPQEIISHLDIFVRGQDLAKRTIAKAVYFHYLTLVDAQAQRSRMPTEHSLIIGPTGSGKTHLVKTLGEFLGVPLFYCDASSLTAEGYVGESVGDMLARFQRSCGSDRFRMSRAILFLDEIDKLAAARDERDAISTRRVQQELLTLLDGNKLSRTSHHEASQKFSVDTSKLLVIASGAFVGLDAIAQRRRERSALGFRAAPVDGAGAEPHLPEAADLVEFGLIPELAGRFTNFIRLDALTEEDLVAILRAPEQSPITRMARLAELHGIDLVFEDEALTVISSRALKNATGARSLRAEVAKVLTAIDWRLDTLRDEGIAQIVVHGDCAQGLEPPRLHRGQKQSSEAARRLRGSVFSPAAETGPEAADHHGTEALPSEPASYSPDITDTETTPQPIRYVDFGSELPDGITNTAGWSDEALWQRYSGLRDRIGYSEATGSALKWWNAFEEENSSRIALVLRLTEELLRRRASISEFFCTYVYSNTDNIQANIDYMDFIRWRDAVVDVQQNDAAANEAARSDLVTAAWAESGALLHVAASSVPAQLYWRIVELQFIQPRSNLVALSKALRGNGVLTADALLQLAALAQHDVLDALPYFANYLTLRLFESERKDSELGAKLAAIFRLTPEGTADASGESDIERCLVHLRDFAVAHFVRSMVLRFPAVASRYLHNWTLQGLLGIKEPNEGKLPPSQVLPLLEFRSGTTLDERVACWEQALRAYPGELPVDTFPRFVAAQLAPALQAELMDLSSFQWDEVSEVLAKAFSYNIPSEEMRELLVRMASEH